MPTAVDPKLIVPSVPIQTLQCVGFVSHTFGTSAAENLPPVSFPNTPAILAKVVVETNSIRSTQYDTDPNNTTPFGERTFSGDEIWFSSWVDGVALAVAAHSVAGHTNQFTTDTDTTIRLRPSTLVTFYPGPVTGFVVSSATYLRVCLKRVVMG